MKDFIIKPEHLRRIEMWAGTTIFVFSIFFLVTNTGETREYLFQRANIRFDYYDNHFFPKLIGFALLYLTFLLLNFKTVPNLIRREHLATNIVILVLVFTVLGLCFGVIDTYSKGYLSARFKTEQEFYNASFRGSFLYAFWLMFMFGTYSVIKHVSVYLLSNSSTISSKYSMISKDSLIAFVLWMISLFILLIGEVRGELLMCWVILGPSAIAFYCYSSYALLPNAFQKPKPFKSYILRTLLVLLIAFIPVAFIFILVIQNEEGAFALSLFNSAAQLLLTAPLSWVIYKRRQQGSEEIFVLQKELGRSNANLDFLRSQINPHFLFNALNTIYASAINEKAERTGEAIEKLGEMMRFMLHENMQEKISLIREIEYLENYIGLQKLRTEHNPALKIETQIEQNLDLLSIAPMLLIPFVENAFKHGISFREPSQIRVTLEVRDKTLFFDVYNSKHEKQENDPEKNKSGIGLANVRQRLQMLYPGKHELLIRETGKEFFVHLTVQLS